MYEKVIAALEKADDLGIQQIHLSLFKPSTNRMCAVGVLFWDMLGLEGFKETYDECDDTVAKSIRKEMHKKYFPDMSDKRAQLHVTRLMDLNDCQMLSFKQIIKHLKEIDQHENLRSVS